MNTRTYTDRAREKRILGYIPPTPSQTAKIWSKKQKLLLIQQLIRSTGKDTAINRALILKSLELHNKLAGHYNNNASSQQDTGRVMYITKEDNDNAWLAAVASQQKELPMPQHVEIIEEIKDAKNSEENCGEGHA